MFCTICGKENREGAKFCRYCGNKLEEEIICPRCGSAMDAEDVFCERCGYKKGDQLEIKPIVEEKIVEEYPKFESETPYEYGEEKPIIEEYDTPFSNKTIEDYVFDDYGDIPEMNDPFNPPLKEETFEEIEKNIPEIEKKEIIEEKKKETKEVKKIEKKERINDGKFINVLLSIVSVTIIAMMFLPLYSSGGSGEYISKSFATMRDGHFLNYFSFIRLIFADSSIIISSKIDRMQYIFISVTMTVIIISMLKILIFALKNLKGKLYNNKYHIPFVVSLVSILILFVASNVNSVPVYIVLSLCLAVLIHKYFYEDKFNFGEFFITLFLLSLLGFFLIAFRNIGIIDEYNGFSSWSKFGIGRYFGGLSSELPVGADLNYVKDLISFLGWATSISLGLGMLMGIVVFIKIIRAIYTDEPAHMPVISMITSVCMIITALIFSAFAKSNCERYNCTYIADMKFNAWLIITLLLGIFLCLIFGLMNFKLNKDIKKQKELEK